MIQRHFCSLILIALLPGAAPRAWAQPTSETIDSLFDQFTAAGHIVSAEDAGNARSSLSEAKPEDLTPAQRVRLIALRALIALAEGDAVAATQEFERLRADAPQAQETWSIGYLSAAAAGDAQSAEAALKELAERVDADERRALSRKRRWARGVGGLAPDVEIETSDGAAFSARRRGDNVLLIDFWNLRHAPDHQIDAMRGLFSTYRNERRFELVGVNTDDADRAVEARGFAKEKRYSWPQCFERVSRKAPITHGAFRAGTPPWMVLIDSFGYVRAIGTADDAGLHYALRAALAEADGRLGRVLTCTRDGTRPEPRARIDTSAGAAASGSGGSSARGGSRGGGEALKDDPNAQNLLTEARLLMRQKRNAKAKEVLRRIISEHPGTIQAKKAAEFLDGLD